MLGRVAAAAALIALAGCAGLEPAGRNATRADAPSPPARTASAQTQRSAPVAPPPSYVPPPPSQVHSPAPPVAQQAQLQPPPVAAPSVAAPAPPPPPPPANNEDVTVVAPARQIEPPHGDPRSVAERREDIQIWDHCVLQVQQTYAADPLEPETETPEDICRRQLGQANRTAVPTSRLVRHGP
jgi:hypothetical protein